MNFFEQELRKLTDIGIDLDNVKFAGRACYGDLGGQNRTKLQFVTTGYADHYSALSVNILNRTDGKVDSLLFRFKDIWGSKPTDSPYLRDGIIPHIWTNNGKSEWYVYTPTPRDFEKLAESVNDYLSVFAERRAERDRKQTLTSQLHEAIAETQERNAARTPQTRAKSNSREIG